MPAEIIIAIAYVLLLAAAVGDYLRGIGGKKRPLSCLGEEEGGPSLATVTAPQETKRGELL